MKHTAKVLFLFMSLFILSQILGLSLLSLSVQEVVETPQGSSVVYSNTSIGERPDVDGYNSLIYIALGVLVGTVLLLLLAKYQKVKIWKVWYLLAAWMTMSISLGAIFGERLYLFAWILAAVLAWGKISYPHPVLHNATELLMYAGIGILLAPILSVPVAIALLLVASVYDAYAVWKSKHMITLAEFTKKSSLFPGLALAYTQEGGKTRIIHHSPEKKSERPHSSSANTFHAHSKMSKAAQKNARIGVLGGGDVIFPLLFAGAVFSSLIAKGFSSASALGLSLIVSLGAAVSLVLLFIYGKQDRYYPALPFITAGCLAGFLVMKLVLLL